MSSTSEPNPQTTLTIKELAGRWQMSAKWLNQLVREGRLPFMFKICGSWRAKLKDVEAYEESQKVSPNP